MEHRFEAQGLDFVVECQGFMDDTARLDFDTICEQIEAAIEAMPAPELTRLHAGAIEATDGPEAQALDVIGSGIKAEVTRRWHNPNGAMVSLIALPAGA